MKMICTSYTIKIVSKPINNSQTVCPTLLCHSYDPDHNREMQLNAALLGKNNKQ